MRLCEFDFTAAGLNVARATDMISEETYQQYLALPKPQRVVKFGLWERDQQNGARVYQEITELRDRFAKSYRIPADAIHEQTLDSVYVDIGKCDPRVISSILVPEFEFFDPKTEYQFHMKTKEYQASYQVTVKRGYGNRRFSANFLIPVADDEPMIIRKLTAYDRKNTALVAGFKMAILQMRMIAANPASRKMHWLTRMRSVYGSAYQFILNTPVMDSSLQIIPESEEVRDYGNVNYTILAGIGEQILNEK